MYIQLCRKMWIENKEALVPNMTNIHTSSSKRSETVFLEDKEDFPLSSSIFKHKATRV